MKKLLLLTVSVFVVLLFAGIGSAQAVSAEKARLVDELLQILNSKQEMQTAFDDIMSMQDEIAVKAVEEMLDREKSLSPQEKTLAKEMVKSSLARMSQRVDEFFKKEIDLDKIFDEIVRGFYFKNFTEEELQTTVDFHKTSAGKKTLALAPQLMKDTMAVFTDQVLPKLGALMETITKEEFVRIKEETTAKIKLKPRKKKS